ncbi:hypothetical protein [Streptomyces sp. NPDC006368]|uniref:hypothetical protein n=1 Tax=Streptomyces sp. NPDC006368 TaxID=3156760 RepID=UPI0033B1CE7A
MGGSCVRARRRPEALLGETNLPDTHRKRHRAVATGYDKPAVRREATVLVAVLNEWL